MGSSSLVISIVLLVLCHPSFGDNVTLEVPEFGVFNGTEETSTYTDRPFFAFRSIFYAEKPTPDNRFLPPVPRQPYPMDEVQQATRNNAGCPQPRGDEDCLSLNVFTPRLPAEGEPLLPVLFWIHGGAFSLGQAIEYSPNRYMEHDIVMVVIQYRLGPLGFLSFDTDDVPGINAAIFDQIEALRWVNKYITAFGGDPGRITIAGESAGSASVTMLLLAPQARGLFQQAIGQSGSVLAEWAIDRDGRGKTASLRIAEIAGCPLEPYDTLLDCVRNIDPFVLCDAYKTYSKEDMLNGGLGFSGSNPVIQVAGKDRVIEKDPRELLASGNYTTNVPVLFGANKQEGSFVLGVIYNRYLEPNNLTDNATFLANDAVPAILNALHIEDESGELAAALTEEYLGYAEMGNITSMEPGMVDMCSVLFLKAPTYETMQYHSEHNPNSYFYAFNFLGRNSIFDLAFAVNTPPISHGVSHGDDLIYFYIFPFPSVPPGLNRTEEVLSKKMLQVWTNFVIHGNPTPDGVELLAGIPDFPVYSRSVENYMAIEDGDWVVRTDFTQTYTVTVDELGLNDKPAERENSFFGK